MRRPFLRLLAVLALATFGTAACSDTPTGGSGAEKGPEAQIGFSVNLSGMSVNMLVVEVTAADITTPLAFNIPVNDGTAAGSLTVPAGTARTITVRAYDAQGALTHEGASTVDVRPGQNVNVPITLVPRAGHVPISINFGSVVVSVARARTAPAGGDLVGDTMRLNGSATYADGSAVPGARLSWATLNPAVATVDSLGLVTARAAGSTQIVATYGGYGASLPVTIVLADGTGGTVDRTIPKLISFTVNPDTADMNGHATREVTFSATAEDAGGYYYMSVFLHSPDGQMTKECSFSKNPEPGRFTLSCGITVSHYSQAGRWSVSELVIYDARGNGRSFTPAELASGGHDNGVTLVNTGTDVTPPTLQAATFQEDTIYAGNGYSQATIQISTTDSQAGIEKVEVGGSNEEGTFGFGGPGGSGSIEAYPGVWQSYLGIDADDPPAGTIRLDWVRITDRAGNVTELGPDQLDALGMRAKLVIIR
jgi:hypothetical protein